MKDYKHIFNLPIFKTLSLSLSPSENSLFSYAMPRQGLLFKTLSLHPVGSGQSVSLPFHPHFQNQSAEEQTCAATCNTGVRMNYDLWDYPEFDDYEDPLYVTSAGCAPIADDNIYGPCPNPYYKYQTKLAVALDPLHLAGAGAVAVQEDTSESPNADGEHEEKLTAKDDEKIQGKITEAENKATKRNLEVKTLQIGKANSDPQLEKALDEEGFGKKKRRAKKLKLQDSLKLLY